MSVRLVGRVIVLGVLITSGWWLGCGSANAPISQGKTGSPATKADTVNDGNPAGDGTAGDAGDGGTVSFKDQVQPLLTMTCLKTKDGTKACHSGPDLSDVHGLDLSEGKSYAMLLSADGADECDSRARVAPGHPEQSYLIDKVKGTNFCGLVSVRMPKGEDPLTDAQIQMLSDWITQGAVDDTPAGVR